MHRQVSTIGAGGRAVSLFKSVILGTIFGITLGASLWVVAQPSQERVPTLLDLPPIIVCGGIQIKRSVKLYTLLVKAFGPEILEMREIPLDTLMGWKCA